MKYIIDYITVFCDWLINLFTSVFLLLWNVILIIVEVGKFLISVVSSLPTIIIIPSVGLIICCILYKVLG
ncbi:MAG: hypothetical protein K2H01_05750, partial [Ruminococcus sp.]|nr:hypothetical protein [Ruminococcus sp.]